MKEFYSLVARHWFIPIAILVIMTCLVFNSLDLHAANITPELQLIFLSFGLPFFYAVCYRRSPKGRVFVRSFMLMLLGLWVASLIIPVSDNGFISKIIWIKHLKWPLVLYFEIQIAVSIWRLVHKQRKSVDEAYDILIQEKGLPIWVGKVAGLEVNFWKFVGRKLSFLKKKRN